MSLQYRVVNWNRQKKIYDMTVAGAVVAYLAAFVAANLTLHPDVTAETLLIRGLATCAFVLLHGITNCPLQFLALAESLRAGGDNVLVPRVDHHGLTDRMTTDLVRRAGVGTGAAMRTLAAMVGAGIVSVARSGNQRLYSANASSPVFHELRSLVLKTVGAVEPLREVLRPFGPRIREAFIYGSVASGTEGPSSDVDVLIVSDDLSYYEAYEALIPAEQVLARPVNVSIISRTQWRDGRAQAGSFLARIAAGPTIPIVNVSRGTN